MDALYCVIGHIIETRIHLEQK